MKQFICINCPLGCMLSVDDSNLNNIVVTGNGCPRGKTYAVNEVTSPKRTVTTTVKVQGGTSPLVSVKTDTPIAKHLIFESLQQLKTVTVTAPITIGDVVLADVLGTGVNFVATKSVSAK